MDTQANNAVPKEVPVWKSLGFNLVLLAQFYALAAHA